MQKNALLSILANEKTRHLMGQLAQGYDPRLAVAELAGHTLSEQVAKILGARDVVGRVGGSAKVGQTTGRAQSVDSNVEDAEYVVIDVSPGVKKRTGKEK